MKRGWMLLLWGLTFGGGQQAWAQSKLIAGPVQGHTTEGSMRLWLLLAEPGELQWQLEGEGQATVWTALPLITNLYKNYAVAVLEVDGLESDTPYRLRLRGNGSDTLTETSYWTRPAAQAQDFSFLLGSCAFKGVGSDKLVEPKGHDFKIFEAMSRTPGDFMLWTGDNVYYLKGEWNSRRKMARKQIGVRLDPILNGFLTSREQYAIWDDHDFGPNNADGTFKNKEESLEMFRTFWPNPPSDHPATPGNFFKFTFGDAEFFMMDDRYHRIDEGFVQMWGKEQLAWLEDGLRNSQATWRFVVNGNQLLNEIGGHETQYNFKEEQAAFFQFLRQEKIEGVVFLSGDRHFTELLRKEADGLYPLYDFTSSPLTSWVRKVAGRDEEAEKEMRIPGTQVVDWNYGRVEITGPVGDRRLTLMAYDKGGKELWRHTILRKDLSFP
jgi:alkaline phosphatase D